MRGLCFGRLSSAVGAGVQVLANLVGRLVVPATAASWPYGSWFQPDGTDPATGLHNNQMGVETAGFGLGVWARGWKDPAGLSQQNLRGTAGNPTAVTLPSGGFGNQVTVAFSSATQWHLGVGADSRNVAATVSGAGPFQVTIDSETNAAGDAFYAPINIPMIGVVAFGGSMATSIQNGNGAREVRSTGGSW